MVAGVCMCGLLRTVRAGPGSPPSSAASACIRSRAGSKRCWLGLPPESSQHYQCNASMLPICALRQPRPQLFLPSARRRLQVVVFSILALLWPTRSGARAGPWQTMVAKIWARWARPTGSAAASEGPGLAADVDAEPTGPRRFSLWRTCSGRLLLASQCLPSGSNP